MYISNCQYACIFRAFTCLSLDLRHGSLLLCMAHLGWTYFALQAVAESAVSEGGVGLPGTEQQLSRLRSALQGMTIYLERACCLLPGVVLPQVSLGTLLKMGRYYNTTMCHYWDMSVN